MNIPVDGTENQTVICERLMNRPGWISSFWTGQCTDAPTSHATNMSNTERSKVMSKVCENRSSAVIA